MQLSDEENIKIVVYSAIFGAYDSPPPTRSGEVDDLEWILFSDRAIECPGWTNYVVARVFADDKMNAQFYKTRPAELFGHNVIAVWVDGNLRNLNLNRTAVRAALADGAALVAAPRHRIRNSVAEEIAEVRRIGLDVPVRVGRAVELQRDYGFRDDVGLSATMLVVRDLRDHRVQAADRLWWQTIVRGSRRDQLSFDFAYWAQGLAVQEINVDWRGNNALFLRTTHAGKRVNVAQEFFNDPTASERYLNAPERPALPSDYPIVSIYPDERWSRRALDVVAGLNELVQKSREPMEGNVCYFHMTKVHRYSLPDPRRSWKREFLRHAVLHARRMLEVGFNAGHSASIILTANPALQLHCADLGKHAYSHPCAGLLSETFGDRVRFSWGDSREVLKGLPDALWADFDLVHIDGGHSADVAASDFYWYMTKGREGSLLLLDDAYVKHIVAIVKHLKAIGAMIEVDAGFPSSGENRLYRKLKSIASLSQTVPNAASVARWNVVAV